jgi:hypothetical protein
MRFRRSELRAAVSRAPGPKPMPYEGEATRQAPSNMPKNHLPAILYGIVFLLSAGVGSAEDSAVEGTGHIDAKSFRCITEMTHVRQFCVDNVLGNLDAAVPAA